MPELVLIALGSFLLSWTVNHNTDPNLSLPIYTRDNQMGMNPLGFNLVSHVLDASSTD